MEVVAIAGATVGAVGFLFGLFFGWRLHRWERYLQHARVAVAYKNKVKLQAPLIEWVQWCNMLSHDQRSTGRVVYRMGGTSVAILKPPPRQHGKTKSRTIKEAA